MSTKDKLINRVLSIPSDLTYDELKKFLEIYNFKEDNRGKTSGSRVKFIREIDKAVIFLHKPHPENIIGKTALRAVIQTLKEQGAIAYE